MRVVATESGAIAAKGLLVSLDDVPHDHDHDHGESYATLKARIENAALDDVVKDHALAILAIIARAESAIHGQPLDAVHFHEVADWDSLADVVGAAAIIASLEGASWSVSDLPLGGGTIMTAHGRLPVPAPATAEILIGYTLLDDGIAGERVTPTGAAIVRHLTHGDAGRRPVRSRLVCSGYGAGTRRLSGIPNVVRTCCFSAPEESAQGEVGGSVAVVEWVSFDIDDMSGEEIGLAAEALRECPGVIDLATMPLMGKKSRPLTRFELLVEPACLDVVAEAVFTQTSTLGLRHVEAHRRLLSRHGEAVGDHCVKHTLRPGGGTTTKLESDELQRYGSLAERRRVKARMEGDHNG